MGRVDPMPDPATLAAVFDDGYFVGGGARGGYDDYDADAATHRANAAHRLAALPHVSRPDAPPLLVDVGCATGHGLDVARDLGWHAIGVEVSPGAADAARAKGFRVESSLDALLPTLAATVDAVCFSQALEHLPDPLAAARSAAGLLRPGGVVVIETWNHASLIARASGRRWQQLSPPSVLWVFHRQSLHGLLSRAGLRQTSWRRTSKLVSIGLVAGQLGPRLPTAWRGVAGSAARRFGGVRVRYGLGDLVAVEATKPLAPQELTA